jgi:hypothetical protein
MFDNVTNEPKAQSHELSLYLILKNVSTITVTFIITPHTLLNVSCVATLDIIFDARG